MKLSVALCTYNGETYIQEQIESILKQDLPVSEIVICDDGSNDKTIDIITSISSSHQEVRWNIHENKPKLGVIKNFEKAISLCTGDIIFLSDQDDIWKKNKTAVISDYFNKHKNISVIFTDAELVDKDRNKLSNHTLLDAVGLLPNIEYWNKGLEFEILCSMGITTGATMSLKKDFRKNVIPLSVYPANLHDSQIAMVACIKKSLALIPDSLIYYRQHGNNVVGISSDNWIYNNDNKVPNFLAHIIKTHNIKDCYWKHKNFRMVFYSKRKQFISQKSGLFFIILLTCMYMIFYKSYWMDFFLSDLFFYKKNILHK